MNKRRKKGIYNLYNIVSIVCIELIIISLFIIFEPAKFIRSGIENIQTAIKNSKEEKEISKDDAKEIAIERFKKLGETNINKESLTVLEVDREDGLYYFIYSNNNSLELSAKGGHVIRINAEPVSE